LGRANGGDAERKERRSKRHRHEDS
jgi:hypothetical protein